MTGILRAALLAALASVITSAVAPGQDTSTSSLLHRTFVSTGYWIEN